MKKCKECAVKFSPNNSLQKVCSPGCAIAYARSDNGKKNAAKAKTGERKDKNKVFDAAARLNDVNYQHGLTKTVFNRMRVLQELAWFDSHQIQPYCISCLKENMDWCCGHFKTVGAQGSIRYYPVNTYLQCNRNCNMGLSGNISGNKTSIGYLGGLEHRFGQEQAQSIIDYCEESTATRKFTGQWLVEFRRICSAEVRRLEGERALCG